MAMGEEAEVVAEAAAIHHRRKCLRGMKGLHERTRRQTGVEAARRAAAAEGAAMMTVLMNRAMTIPTRMMKGLVRCVSPPRTAMSLA